MIVLQVEQLRRWAGGIIGGLIGIMLAGAAVMPFFGGDRFLLGLAAGIVTVFVSGWLGLRLVRLTAKR